MSAVRKLGFTGTSQVPGMTPAQQIKLASVLMDLWKQGFNEFHHGDCICADDQAQHIAKQIGFRLVAHPGPNKRYRAWSKADEIRPVKPNLIRNDIIVAEVERLVAAPNTPYEVRRSGTWATIRHTIRRFRKPIDIIAPDGSLLDSSTILVL